jgi:hypothetical protein
VCVGACVRARARSCVCDGVVGGAVQPNAGHRLLILEVL